MRKPETGRSLAMSVFKDYAEAVRRSDGLISQYETLENLKELSSSQIARMKELEQEIPEAVAKDKALKEKVVELLKLPGPALSARHLQVLELRYLNGMEWKEVICAIYGQRDDYEKNFISYQHRVILQHGKGLDIIGAALDQKPV